MHAFLHINKREISTQRIPRIHVFVYGIAQSRQGAKHTMRSMLGLAQDHCRSHSRRPTPQEIEFRDGADVYR